jgi:hypothetical protein
MKRYLTCLAAYLTGWVIAQALFQRLWKYAMKVDTEKMRQEYVEKMAGVIADELEARGLESQIGERHEAFADAIWNRLAERDTAFISQDDIRRAARDLWSRLA